MEWAKIISSVLAAIIISIAGTLYAVNTKIVTIEGKLNYELESRFKDIERRIESGIKGDTGPVGERGEQGVVGPAGPQGPKGDPANLPVGTIIASVLKPNVFYKEFGKSWILADGSDISSLSEYAKITESSNVPDCRGVFLRGNNAGKTKGDVDPNTRRTAGSYQPDSVDNHTVSRLYADNPDWNKEFVDSSMTDHENTKKYKNGLVATETRPKNISVFYYIKIN